MKWGNSHLHFTLLGCTQINILYMLSFVTERIRRVTHFIPSSFSSASFFSSSLSASFSFSSFSLSSWLFRFTCCCCCCCCWPCWKREEIDNKLVYHEIFIRCYWIIAKEFGGNSIHRNVKLSKCNVVMFKIFMVRNSTCSEKQAITLTFQSTKPKRGIFPHNYVNIILVCL